MSREARRKAKLLRKLKPTNRIVYDKWWTLCFTIAEYENLSVEETREFMVACGVPKIDMRFFR